MLKRRCQAGVTVIELAIAIAILAVLLTVGMPSFMGYMANQRVRSVAEGFVGALQTARIEAAKRNQLVSFRLDASTGGAWSVVLAEGTVLQTKGAAEGGNVVVDIVPAGGNTITFNSLGQRTVPLPGVGLVALAVTNPGAGNCQPSGEVRCLSITIQPGGQVRMCDPQRPSGDPQACDI